MKKLAVVSGLIGLLLAACGTIQIEPETPAATDDVVVTSEPTEQAEPTAEPTDAVSAPDAAGEGVGLNYPSDAIGAATFTQVAASPAEPAWAQLPQHVEVTFGQYPALGSRMQPTIYVFRVEDLLATNSEMYGPIVERLAGLIADDPAAAASSQGITPLPVPNAQQTLLVKWESVAFQNGRGVRFYTHFAQSFIPVTSADGFYTFQGLTDDGQYYVSAMLPAGQADLPATTPDLTDWLPEPVDQNYRAYVAETATALDAADPASFTPTLGDLDALIESLRVEPAPGA